MSVSSCPFCKTDLQQFSKDSVKASLYLRAILPGLSDLVNLDNKAKEIITNTRQKVLFSLRNGEKTFLKIEKGTIRYSPVRDETPTIHLLLLNPTHAVQVFEQGKLPILLKGFTQISFLKKGLDSLTKRLEYYLKGGQNYSEEERKIYAMLQLKTAGRAVEVLAEKDDISKKILANTPPGILKIAIESIDFSICIGNMEGKWKFIEAPSVQGVTSLLSLKDLETTELLLNNKLDTFAGLGLGKIHISGVIPIIDNIGLVLGRITEYIS